MNFKQINLIDPLQRALAEIEYSEATEIQSKAIPEALKGRDMLGCAQTGTGKTAAFALPILQILNSTQRNKNPRALILTPTRELALQIQNNFKMYGKYLQLRSETIYGGVPQGKQVKALKRGVDILIATPGRLLDLINQGFVRLHQIEILVLDEADRMLDMGFIHDIKKVLSMVPDQRQTLFFSATVPKNIRQFAETILHKPVEITITPETKTADTVEQSLYLVDKKKKTGLLKDILNQGESQRSLIFMRTKHSADKLAKTLTQSGIFATAIHGNKSQNARQKALNQFKHEKVKVLVATDVASRGIDIDELPLVINYDLPNEPETYIHRIGRTGRAGHEGRAISFCTPDEKQELRQIQKLIGFKIPVIGNIHSENEAADDASQSPQQKSDFSKRNNRKPNFKFNKYRKNARRKSKVL